MYELVILLIYDPESFSNQHHGRLLLRPQRIQSPRHVLPGQSDLGVMDRWFSPAALNGCVSRLSPPGNNGMFTDFANRRCRAEQLLRNFSRSATFSIALSTAPIAFIEFDTPHRMLGLPLQAEHSNVLYTFSET